MSVTHRVRSVSTGGNGLCLLIDDDADDDDDKSCQPITPSNHLEEEHRHKNVLSPSLVPSQGAFSADDSGG